MHVFRCISKMLVAFVAIVIAMMWPPRSFAQQNSIMRVYTAAKGAQTIFCEIKLAMEDCSTATEILTSHLQAYPVSQLGTWTWVIVPSDHWNDLGKDLGLDSDSPDYTCIENRMTLIDESMLTQDNARRNAELLRKFELPLPGLIDFAVTHELGHASADSRTSTRRMRWEGDCGRDNCLTARYRKRSARSSPSPCRQMFGAQLMGLSGVAVSECRLEVSEIQVLR